MNAHVNKCAITEGAASGHAARRPRGAPAGDPEPEDFGSGSRQREARRGEQTGVHVLKMHPYSCSADGNIEQQQHPDGALIQRMPPAHRSSGSTTLTSALKNPGATAKAACEQETPQSTRSRPSAQQRAEGSNDDDNVGCGARARARRLRNITAETARAPSMSLMSGAEMRTSAQDVRTDDAAPPSSLREERQAAAGRALKRQQPRHARLTGRGHLHAPRKRGKRG